MLWGRCTLDSEIRLGWEVNIKSIKAEEFSKMCIGSFKTWYNSHCDETFSIAIPSKFVLSCLYQLVHLALKSPGILHYTIES